MKKILLIALLFSAIFSFSQDPTKWLREKTIEKTKLYEAEVLTEEGTIQKLNQVQSVYALNLGQDLMDSVKFMWFGNAASVKRDGTNYAEIVDMSGNDNHGTQTTESSQPYVTGNIAPSTFEGMKNPNGDSRYITHPEISFAANEAWSVTTVLNWNGSSNNYQDIYGTPFGSTIRIKSGTNRFLYVDADGSSQRVGGSTNSLIGKNTVVTVVVDIAGGSVNLYRNGILEVIFNSVDFNFIFNLIFKGRSIGGTSDIISGTIFTHIIRSEALTADQVLAEANFLQSIYPEIPSVEIGDQTWAVENCEMVATPMGSVISNVTDATEWASSQSIYDDSITAGYSVYEATKFAAMWCYYNNDTEIGAVYGKLYNWFAVSLLQQDIDLYNAANPDNHWGWHVPSSTEFTALQNNLGGSAVAGGKMKLEGTDYWDSPNTGATNSSGFSSLAGGRRSGDGGFGSKLDGNYLACINDYTNINQYLHLTLANNTEFKVLASTSKEWGFNLRLIKD